MMKIRNYAPPHSVILPVYSYVLTLKSKYCSKHLVPEVLLLFSVRMGRQILRPHKRIYMYNYTFIRMVTNYNCNFT